VKPLIFSPAMNAAYRAGRKTETRRVVKVLESFGETVGIVYVEEGEESHSGPGWYAYDTDYPDEGSALVKCPQGAVGERVYIKEALVALDVGFKKPRTVARYLTDSKAVLVNGEPLVWRWKPRRLAAMYMPHEACRAMPKLTSLKIERVQKITACGCIAEGLSSRLREHDACCDLRDKFAALWNSLHAKPKPVYRTEKGKKILTHYESYPWDESSRDPREKIGRVPHLCLPNPYVWVEGLGRFRERAA